MSQRFETVLCVRSRNRCLIAGLIDEFVQSLHHHRLACHCQWSSYLPREDRLLQLCSNRFVAAPKELFLIDETTRGLLEEVDIQHFSKSKKENSREFLETKFYSAVLESQAYSSAYSQYRNTGIRKRNRPLKPYQITHTVGNRPNK